MRGWCCEFVCFSFDSTAIAGCTRMCKKVPWRCPQVCIVAHFALALTLLATAFQHWCSHVKLGGGRCGKDYQPHRFGIHFTGPHFQTTIVLRHFFGPHFAVFVFLVHSQPDGVLATDGLTLAPYEGAVSSSSRVGEYDSCSAPVGAACGIVRCCIVLLTSASLPGIRAPPVSITHDHVHYTRRSRGASNDAVRLQENMF